MRGKVSAVVNTACLDLRRSMRVDRRLFSFSEEHKLFPMMGVFLKDRAISLSRVLRVTKPRRALRLNLGGHTHRLKLTSTPILAILAEEVKLDVISSCGMLEFPQC